MSQSSWYAAWTALLLLAGACSSGSHPADAAAEGDAAASGCAPEFLIQPSQVPLAKRSPDGKGWCCQPSYPTCDCGSFGGFVRERCHCGEAARPGVETPAGSCDLAPPDWILEEDAHGCSVYHGRVPTTACCNCPPKPDAG